MTLTEAMAQIETWMKDGTLTGIEITQESGGLALDAAIDGEYGHFAVMRETFEEALVAFVEDGKLYLASEAPEDKPRFVVRNPRSGGYLDSRSFRDGANKLRRSWMVNKEHAKVFCLRRNAEKAADRWDGVVELFT